MLEQTDCLGCCCVFKGFKMFIRCSSVSDLRCKGLECSVHDVRLDTGNVLGSCSQQVHAILVQLPLPEHIDAPLVLSKIRVDKDPDLCEVSSSTCRSHLQCKLYANHMQTICKPYANHMQAI